MRQIGLLVDGGVTPSARLGNVRNRESVVELVHGRDVANARLQHRGSDVGGRLRHIREVASSEPGLVDGRCFVAAGLQDRRELSAVLNDGRSVILAELCHRCVIEKPGLGDIGAIVPPVLSYACSVLITALGDDRRVPLASLTDVRRNPASRSGSPELRCGGPSGQRVRSRCCRPE